MEPADHYRNRREELTELFTNFDDEQLATVVPGCPKWVVRDVLSHLVGLTADVCSQNLDNAGSPAWTGAQVEARKDKSVAEVLEEWSKRAVGFEESIPEMGFLGWVFTADVTMHGDDVKEALGLPLATSETQAVILDWLIKGADKRAEGIGALTLRAGDREWTIGSGEPVASVTAPDAAELSRAVGARRTDEQVLALDWTGDPTPWLDVLPLFRAGR